MVHGIVQSGRVERWRGGLGGAYLFPALSSAGASLALPCSGSTSRSSNRTGGFPASGSRTGFSERYTMRLSKRDHHLRLSVQSLLGRLGSKALLGRSQSLALVPFDDAPELRPLRSTGITRLRRYYEPLRHPERPGHLLTEFRLRIRTLTVGASRVAPDLLVPTCRRHCPGGIAVHLAHLGQRWQPSLSPEGRLPH